MQVVQVSFPFFFLLTSVIIWRSPLSTDFALLVCSQGIHGQWKRCAHPEMNKLSMAAAICRYQVHLPVVSFHAYVLPIATLWTSVAGIAIDGPLSTGISIFFDKDVPLLQQGLYLAVSFYPFCVHSITVGVDGFYLFGHLLFLGLVDLIDRLTDL